MSGKDAEARSDAAGIVLNKNAIPNDPAPPSIASGIRVGSPSVTTQGMTEPQMAQIAQLIARAVGSDDESVHRAVRAEVGELVAAHPAYPHS